MDGWAWNEIETFPLPWFSGLALLFEMVEITGVWPQALLDAYIAMIPKADGDSTPSGQRPLSVLPMVLWRGVDASVSLGNGLSSVEAWFSTALDNDEVFLSGVGGELLSRSLMSSGSLTRWTALFLIVLWVGWVCLRGSGRSTSLFMTRFGSEISWLLGLGGRGVGWWYSPDCPLSMVFIVALYVPWCRLWKRYLL